LRGMNCSVLPMIVSIIGVCGIRVMWVTFLFPLFNTLDFLYVSYPISWIITSGIHFICYLIIVKKLNNSIKISNA